MKSRTYLIILSMSLLLMGCSVAAPATYEKTQMSNDSSETNTDYSKHHEEKENHEIETDHEHKYFIKPLSDNTHKIICEDEDCEYELVEDCKYDVTGYCECGNQIDDISAFIDLAVGVWGHSSEYDEEMDTPIFYGFYENGNLLPGYFQGHQDVEKSITRVKRDGDVYTVEYHQDEYEDELGSAPEADFTYVFDFGVSPDKDIIRLANAYYDTFYLIRMGDDFDEAYDFFCEDFEDVYKEKIGKILGIEEHNDPIGIWYTDGYDEVENWSGSYKITLQEDGTALCEGWRNSDKGSYKRISDSEVIITFDECMVDYPGDGWTLEDGFVYTITLKMSNDTGKIKIEVPDVISNIEDGKVYKN